MNLNKSVFCLMAVFALSVFYPLSNAYAQNFSNSQKIFAEAKNLIQTYSGKGNNYDLAYKAANILYEKNPDDPYAYLIMAELQARLLKDNQSVPEVEVLSLINKVISLDDSIAGAYVLLGKLANMRRDLQTAAINIHKALELEPDNLEANFETALLEQYQGNYKLAQKEYERTIALHTSPERKSNIYFWLGKLHLENDSIEQAQTAMKKGVELTPNAPWKLVNYSLFLSRNTTQYDEAVEYARRALNQMEFGMARKALGMAMYGKWAEKYKDMDYLAVEKLSKPAELAIVKDIELQTGMPIRHIVPLSMHEMPQSSIVTAAALLGL